MKLEDQVCTLEQAKRLKELGVVQDSFFAFFTEGGMFSKHTDLNKLALLNIAGDFYAAFTVAELGVMLPRDNSPMLSIGGHLHASDFDPSAKEKPWYVLFEQDNDKGGFDRILFEGNTEAEARADALIYLLQYSTITAEEVNLRLTA